jgi:hypothetical protein
MKKKFDRPTRLEDAPLWRLASEIALYTYDQLDNFSEDEAYGMEPKLRDRSFDLTADLAEAAGSIDPRDKTYYYGQALRDVYSIRNTLIMAVKTDLMDVEPGIFVKLDRLADGIADEVTDTSSGIPEYLKQFSLQDRKHEN